MIVQALTDAGFLPTEWYKLGKKLNIKDAKLKIIEKDYSDTERQYDECIALWLRQTPASERTWDTIVIALRDIGDIAVAENIESTHLYVLN